MSVDLQKKGVVRAISAEFRMREEEGEEFFPKINRIAFIFLVVLIIAAVRHYSNVLVEQWHKSVYMDDLTNLYNMTSSITFTNLFMSGAIYVVLFGEIFVMMLTIFRLSDIGWNRKEIVRKFIPAMMFSMFAQFFGNVAIFIGGILSIIYLIFIARVSVFESFFFRLYVLLAAKNEKYAWRIRSGEYSDFEISEAYSKISPEEIVQKTEKMSIGNEIRELNELFREGIITEEEFEKKKKKILDI